MTGITIGQDTRLQVKHPQEHCYKHTRFIGFRKRIIQRRQDSCRCLQVRSHGTEKTAGNNHQQRSRYPFTGDIGHRKEQTIILYKEIVQVPPYCLGWKNRSKKVDVLPFREGGKILGIISIWISLAIRSSLSIRSLLAVVAASSFMYSDNECCINPNES